MSGGRIRSFKPEMLEDANVADLSDCAFRLFVGMVLLADDAGRLRADARYLLGQIFWGGQPRTRAEVAEARADLARANIAKLYVVRGQEYAMLRTFGKHQKIDHPSKPKCPGLDEADGEILASPRETVASPSEQLAPDRDRDQEGIGSGEDRTRTVREPASPVPVVSCTTFERTNATDGSEALVELWQQSGGKLAAGASPAQGARFGELLDTLAKQHRLSAADLIAIFAAYAKAGGFSWMDRRSPSVPWLLEDDGAAMVEHLGKAVAWQAGGRLPIANPKQRGDPRKGMQDAAPSSAFLSNKTGKTVVRNPFALTGTGEK